MSKRGSKPIQLTKKQRAPEIGHSNDRLWQDRAVQHKQSGRPGSIICTRCHAVCHDKHWYTDPEEFKDLSKDKSAERALCPGCKRIDQKIYDGQVVLEGEFWKGHKDTVMGLIKHTEGKAWHHNPRARIATIQEDGNRMEILTTTKWLAERIGKEMHKSFKGKLKIQPLPREKFVRVYWSRAA